MDNKQKAIAKNELGGRYKTNQLPKSQNYDAISYVNDSHNPLIITQNGEAKAVIQDIESYQNMKNAIAMLGVVSRSDIRNDRYESQNSFFEKMEQKLSK